MRVAALGESREEVRFPVVEAEVVERAGAEDLGDFAADEFASGHFADLVADRGAPAGGDEFFDVAARGMVGDAAHGGRAALGQGDIEDA